MEEKIANQGEVPRGGITRVCLSLSNKQKPCQESQIGTGKMLSIALKL